jgi:hypothetical protein
MKSKKIGVERRPRGWEARISRRHQRYAKYFSDSVHGGKRASYAAAAAWRALMERKLPAPLRAGRAAA